MYKNYLKKSFLLFLFIILIIATINFTIDPGEIYLKKIITDRKSADFSYKLANSKYGLISKGWNERVVKTALSKNITNFECIVMGSSHIMQLSTLRVPSISKKCSTLMNLGVSGGTLEDIAIFSYLISKQNLKDKEIFIEVSPWALIFNMDKKWTINKEIYDEFNTILNKEVEKRTFSYELSYLSNLINYEYTLTSLKNLNFSIKDNLNLTIKEAPKFNLARGYKEIVILPDGSHVGNLAMFNARKDGQYTPKEGGWYKLGDVLYQTKAINYFNKIIEYLKEHNANVNLILTPYNPKVFRNKHLYPLKNLIAVEEQVLKIHKDHQIKLYGSYNPFNIGCKDNEFFDLQHPQGDCLNKIDFSASLKTTHKKGNKIYE